MRGIRNSWIFATGLFFATMAASCGGYNVKPNLAPEERFDLAKRMFNNKDYLEAKTQFKILTLNNPGANFVDEAQFYLAESHFNMKEYILAADEYSRLTRLYPQSSFVDDAQFKVGVCYYRLSPKPSLDQTYTFKAIEQFQQFLEEFPASNLVPEADKMLQTCRTKLAQKEYKAGELYRKLKYWEAALVYFDSVLNTYYDTKFADDALYWKGVALVGLDRYNEAYQTFKGLVTKFPKSKYRSKAKEQIQELEAEHNLAREADGKAEGNTIIGKQTKN